jgi:hypothetical protein
LIDGRDAGSNETANLDLLVLDSQAVAAAVVVERRAALAVVE